MAALENIRTNSSFPEQKGMAGGTRLEAANPRDLQIRVPDPEDEGAYPIVTYTWVLGRKHHDERGRPSPSKTLLPTLLTGRTSAGGRREARLSEHAP